MFKLVLNHLPVIPHAFVGQLPLPGGAVLFSFLTIPRPYVMVAYKIKLSPLILFLSVCCLVIPGKVFSAVIYEIIKGKGVEVCEAYKKNLESFNEKEPMICERKINPEMKEFSKPKWEKVNLAEHKELLRRLLKYKSYLREQFRKTVEDDVQTFDAIFKYHKTGGYKYILQASFDVDNDGYQDDLLYYKGGDCPDLSASFYFGNIYILRKNPPPGVVDWMIDGESETEKLLREKISSRGYGHYETMDIFRYKNEVYVDRFCGIKNIHKNCMNNNELKVYKIQNSIANEECRIIAR